MPHTSSSSRLHGHPCTGMQLRQRVAVGLTGCRSRSGRLPPDLTSSVNRPRVFANICSWGLKGHRLRVFAGLSNARASSTPSWPPASWASSISRTLFRSCSCTRPPTILASTERLPAGSLVSVSKASHRCRSCKRRSALLLSSGVAAVKRRPACCKRSRETSDLLGIALPFGVLPAPAMTPRARTCRAPRPSLPPRLPSTG